MWPPYRTCRFMEAIFLLCTPERQSPVKSHRQRRWFTYVLINTYLGDIERHYPSLGATARIFSQNIVRHLISQQYIPAKKYQVGCHQIRVRATDGFNAYPTPEGFHQDGFDYVAINCINRNNVNGGESFISNLDENEIIFHGTLTPGKALVLNDRSFKHYVSPITPLFPGEALRDVVVITLHNDRNTT
ncbi:2OG-Fe dioxygenase family protein [Microbulbifer sp. JTAC008]|uniref:2OG-Fe dioxygenase family protein n=1 Tax=unclassified Microbulbifer TaxID=2619833 RepID=UPI004039911E